MGVVTIWGTIEKGLILEKVGNILVMWNYRYLGLYVVELMFI
jgi:hypothetical protein